MMTYKLTKELLIVSCTGMKLDGDELYELSMGLFTKRPEIANVPNIWDFTDTEFFGDLSKLDELYEELAASITAPSRVGFVSNNMLTVAISKDYALMFRDHKYLEFHTFRDLKKCIRWATCKK